LNFSGIGGGFVMQATNSLAAPRYYQRYSAKSTTKMI
jgi:hypothetical protein